MVQWTISSCERRELRRAAEHCSCPDIGPVPALHDWRMTLGPEFGIFRDTMDSEIIAKLGSPSIKLEGLQIWIHRTQFPNSEDYWDGNWLNVTAHCGAAGASVFASGAIIHLSEIERWKIETEALIRNLEGQAALKCMEPALSVLLSARSLGHISMEVSITNDHLAQKHAFLFEIDQSYLEPLVKQCAAVLEDFPIKSPLKK
jgi:hypothetical protein